MALNEKTDWTKNLNSKFANIYLLGNPLVWWFVSLSLVLILTSLFFKKIYKKLPPLIYILIFGFFINLLPFILISRVTFLYHYLSSLTFGILILALFLDKFFLSLPQKKEKLHRLKKLAQKGKLSKKEFLTFPNKYLFFLYFGFLILVFLVFLILAPLSYGFPISAKINQIYNIFIKFLS